MQCKHETMEVAAEAFASNKRRNAIEKSCADPALFQNEGPLDLNIRPRCFGTGTGWLAAVRREPVARQQRQGRAPCCAACNSSVEPAACVEVAAWKSPAAAAPGEALQHGGRRHPAAAAGLDRARSHCRFAPPLIHLGPDPLTYSVALFLKRQCDRTLGQFV